MYDVENIDGETPVLEFNQSEPHLSSDFQRIMSNTHQICTNGMQVQFQNKNTNSISK